MKTLFLFIFLFITTAGWSQTFPVTGQLPSTAFPVCGTDTFRQSVVPYGSSGTLQIPVCNDRYPDANPFYYTFTCYASGSLGLLIQPNNPGDDYDWMLYDITGHNPGDIYHNTSLIVTGNWSGTYGNTGARAGGSNRIQCASYPPDHISTFSAMPNLIKGHKYLLMISHYTISQSGYSLTFVGGSAVIKDPTNPHLLSANVDCDRKTILVGLNKQMRCASLAPDGSDFHIGSDPVSVTGAAGTNCNNAFDMDTLRLTLSTALVPGDYSLIMKTGNDDNTLMDDCGVQVPEGETIPFTVYPPHPTPMDSLIPPACAPNKLQLVFSDPIQCSSIATDGSDFQISGNSVVSISKSGSCSGELTNVIEVELASPIVVGGSYQITLVKGSDGNTIINKCGIETPAGAKISFNLKDTVSASFSYTTALGCKKDTIFLNWSPANGANTWNWNIDSSYLSSAVSPVVIETVFGLKNVQHIVSNGFCTDTVSEIINLDNLLKAAFQAPFEVCPKDAAVFSDSSIGHMVSWSWNFGDGQTSTQEFPPAHLFPDTWGGKKYLVSLVVKDNLGCTDTASQQITKLQSCYITVPNAFTPNGDGKNDFLYPLNAFTAENLEFRVYNRFGQLVFETRDWTQKWNGTINGKPQETGTYVWTLRYTDGSSGKQFSLRGSSVLIR